MLEVVKGPKCFDPIFTIIFTVFVLLCALQRGVKF